VCREDHIRQETGLLRILFVARIVLQLRVHTVRKNEQNVGADGSSR